MSPQQLHSVPIKQLHWPNPKLLNFHQYLDDAPDVPLFQKPRNALRHHLDLERRRELRALDAGKDDGFYNHGEILEFAVASELGGEVGEVGEVGFVGVPPAGEEGRGPGMEGGDWRRGFGGRELGNWGLVGFGGAIAIGVWRSGN